MRRQQTTIHLSPKAYPFDWARLVKLVLLAAVVAAWIVYRYGGA